MSPRPRTTLPSRLLYLTLGLALAGSLAAQGPMLTQAGKEIFPSLRDDGVPSRALVFDADGDGDEDIVVAVRPLDLRPFPPFFLGGRSYLLRRESGRFVDGGTILPPMGDGAVDACRADFDGDGDPDLAFAVFGTVASSYSKGGIRLAFNDGKGNFQPGLRLIAPTVQGTCIAQGDVDGDGDIDLLLGVGFGVELWVNDGRGKFSDASARLPNPVTPHLAEQVRLVDLDGDRDLDAYVLVRNTGNAPTSLVLINDGSGRFVTKSTPAAPETQPGEDCAFGDLDGDGDLDLLITTSQAQQGGNRVLLNDGKANFTDRSSLLLPAPMAHRLVLLQDLDLDGDLDLVLAGGPLRSNTGQRLDTLFNDGRAGFQRTAASLQAEYRALQLEGLVATDLDGRPGPELFGFGLHADLTRYPRVGTGLHQAQVAFLNDGRGALQANTPRLLPERTERESVTLLAAADVDGDGDEDVLSNIDGRDQLWLGDPLGKLLDATASHLPTGSGTPNSAYGSRAAVFFDADGDGDPDLFLARDQFNAPGTDDVLYLNDGLGRFRPAPAGALPRIGARSEAAQAADLDGDGDLDLVIANSYGFGVPTENRYWFNDGAGRFADRTSSWRPRLVGQDPDGGAVLLVDLDLDGFPEVWQCQSTTARLLLNRGLAPLQNFVLSSPPSYQQAALAADFDGDGDPDIWEVAGDGVSTVRENLQEQGSIDFRIHKVSPPRGLYFKHIDSLVCFDFDADGDMDVATIQLGQAHLFRNDGSFAFFPVSSYEWYRPHSAFSVLAADIDGDGDRDLLHGAGPTGTDPRLYHNRSIDLSLPDLLIPGGQARIRLSYRPAIKLPLPVSSVLVLGTKYQPVSLPGLGLLAPDLKGAVISTGPLLHAGRPGHASLSVQLPTGNAVRGQDLVLQAGFLDFNTSRWVLSASRMDAVR